MAEKSKKQKRDPAVAQLVTYRNKVKRLIKHIKKHPEDSASSEALRSLTASGVHTPRRAPKKETWTRRTAQLAQWAARCGYKGDCVLKWGWVDSNGVRARSVYDGWKDLPGFLPGKKAQQKASDEASRAGVDPALLIKQKLGLTSK